MFQDNRPLNATDPTGLWHYEGSEKVPDTDSEREEYYGRKKTTSDGDSKDGGGEAIKEPEYFVYSVRVAGHIIDTYAAAASAFLMAGLKNE